MAQAKQTTKQQSKKCLRNRTWCARYKDTNRREKNKLIRLKKHLLRVPDDAKALLAADRCVKMIRGY